MNEITKEKKLISEYKNHFNPNDSYNNINSQIERFIFLFKEIYEKLFLNYDNRLNQSKLKSQIKNLIAEEHKNKDTIYSIEIFFNDTQIQKLEQFSQSTKHDIENYLKELVEKIIEWYKNFKSDDALGCYKHIFEIISNNFHNKTKYYEINKNENKSKNLEKLKEEYKNILNMICLTNKNTIDIAKLLENLQKFNIINKRFEIS